MAATRAARTGAISGGWQGFTNRIDVASGLQPFARLLEASGQVYRQAPLFIAEVRATLAGEDAMVGGGAEDEVGQGAPELSPIKPLAPSSTTIRITAGTCIEPIWPGRVTPPPWGSRPARFARHSWKRAILPRRAPQNVSVNMPKGQPARPSGVNAGSLSSARRSSHYREIAAMFSRVRFLTKNATDAIALRRRLITN
jgi:hypothetical protein